MFGENSTSYIHKKNAFKLSEMRNSASNNDFKCICLDVNTFNVNFSTFYLLFMKCMQLRYLS